MVDNMNVIEVELQTNRWRPIIDLYNYETLIDTGAVVPVFSVPMEFLAVRFNAKLIKDNVYFGGFGGGKSYGSIYSLSNFYIKKLHFKTLECFIPYTPDKSFSIILSAPLFYHIGYEFRAYENKLILKIPDDKLTNNEFLITNLSDKICVQMNGVMLNG